jgi:hypothetical protein
MEPTENRPRDDLTEPLDRVDDGFGRIDLDSLISIPSRYGAPFVPFMVDRRSWEQERHTQGLDRGRLIASSAWS